MKIVSVSIAAVASFLIGLSAASSTAETEHFVPTVQDAYPDTEGQAMDVLGYGYAVCAGLDDGWTRAELVDWLAGTPHEHLGIADDADEFGEFVVDIAVAALCDGEVSS